MSNHTVDMLPPPMRIPQQTEALMTVRQFEEVLVSPLIILTSSPYGCRRLSDAVR